MEIQEFERKAIEILGTPSGFFKRLMVEQKDFPFGSTYSETTEGNPFSFASTYTSPTVPYATAFSWNGFYHEAISIQQCAGGYALFYTNRNGEHIRLDYRGDKPTPQVLKELYAAAFNIEWRDVTIMMTVGEAAKYYPLAYSTLMEYARTGKLAARKSGAVWLTTPQAVEQMIASKEDNMNQITATHTYVVEYLNDVTGAPFTVTFADKRAGVVMGPYCDEGFETKEAAIEYAANLVGATFDWEDLATFTLYNDSRIVWASDENERP